MEGAAAKTKIFGQHDEATLKQIERCVAAGGERGVLCADGHKGYAQPIGGVVAYKDKISLRLFSAGRSIVGPTEFQVYAAYQLTLGPGK